MSCQRARVCLDSIAGHRRESPLRAALDLQGRDPGTVVSWASGWAPGRAMGTGQKRAGDKSTSGRPTLASSRAARRENAGEFRFRAVQLLLYLFFYKTRYGYLYIRTYSPLLIHAHNSTTIKVYFSKTKPTDDLDIDVIVIILAVE